MVARRLSRLQQQILRWLAADHQRTRGMIVSSHEDLVKGLPADKGNLSRSLRTLEARGWIVIGRSPGGKAQHVTLTPGRVAESLRNRKKVVNKALSQ
jgi:DNA-binding MarR family transcriptional regulator